MLRLRPISTLPSTLASKAHSHPHMHTHTHTREHTHTHTHTHHAQYASQRIVAVTLTVLKKYTCFSDRLEAAITQSQAQGTQGHGATQAPTQTQSQTQLSQMLHVYSRCVEVLLLVVNMCLRRKIIHKNANMIYVLLHKQSEVTACLSHPSIASSPWLGTSV